MANKSDIDICKKPYFFGTEPTHNVTLSTSHHDMFEADLEVEDVPNKIRMIKRLDKSSDTSKQKSGVNKNRYE